MKEKQVRWQKRLSVDFTPQQKEEFAELRISFRERALELRTELARKQIELRKLWLKDDPDKEKIYSLIQDMANIRAQIQKRMMDSFLEARDILTDEQREKLSPLHLGWGMGRPSPLCR